MRRRRRMRHKNNEKKQLQQADTIKNHEQTNTLTKLCSSLEELLQRPRRPQLIGDDIQEVLRALCLGQQAAHHHSEHEQVEEQKNDAVESTDQAVEQQQRFAMVGCLRCIEVL